MLNWNQFLVIAPALLLGIFSGYLSERVGIINIAINGMMVFGALFFYIFSNVFYQSYGENVQDPNFNLTYLASFVITILFGLVVGLLFGFATIKLKCDHVIAGTGINLVAPGIGLIVADNAPALFNGQTSLANQYVFHSQFNLASINGLTLLVFVLGMVIIGAIFVFMTFTKYGLRYKAIGENPNAADAQGINVDRYKWIGILIVGMIASLAGAFFAYALPGGAFSGDVNGLGFIALALLIVSSWKITPSVVIGTLFAILYVYAANQIGADQQTTYALKIIPFVVTLAVMMLFGKFSIGPKAAGKHFMKNMR